MISRLTVAAAIVIVVVLASSGRPGAAPQAPAQGQEVLNALLVEVRGLRAAMEQMASAGPRVQLAFGRLQLQEQRITAAMRKLDETRAEIRGAQATSERLDKELADTEESLRDPEVAKFRDEVAARIKQLRQAKAAAVTQLQRLQLEETTLLNDIAADQARWVEVNRVLEDLDRSLTRR
jgi:chromosome segregation ATPase